MEKIIGLINAPFTPFYENGEVNYEPIEAYAKMLVKNGLQGVFINGSSGEGYMLTDEERMKLAERWVEVSPKGFKVIVHVGSCCVKSSRKLAEHAQKIGVWGIGAMAPPFPKVGRVEELVKYCEEIACGAPDLPFYYYNMPSMTGVSLSVPSFLIEGKKTMPNLVGTKFTHNNLMEMGECLELNNGEFEVLHGYDEILIAGLALGAVAGVGSTYNYLPAVYQNLFDAFKKGDICTARRMQQKSIEIVKIIIKYGGGVRGGKAIMNLIGVDCGRCRLPVTPFGDDEYSSLKRDLEKIGFLN